ncbi:DUF4395 domain-containing protein [Cohnella faecalis]|uniref:DUF4395 domain-containing protein n=1 Tax=Cohnella faecalis TaxID=2315694 RepID=A0A398CEH3_9BACL|nr:DUF4395 domain-containing protein [Cohnella faecalis]RIE00252.1 DUF4395 domain-containing protein [Cohnella faecalis]
MNIPLAYVKANQTGIVLLVLISLLFQPWLLAALWLVQVVGLATNGRWNLFVRIAKPFLQTSNRPTQAAELTRFNNLLAVLFLTVSLLFLLVGWTAAGYSAALMLLAAASAALLGYCVGCTIYFQYKQFRHRVSRKLS